MRRGDSAIVSVTLIPPKEVDSKTLPESDSQLNILTDIHRPKPFYKGKVFEHWFHIAHMDRDKETRLEGLRACVATMETPEEAEQLLALAKPLARSYGGIYTYRRRVDSTTQQIIEPDSYRRILLALLSRCNDDQVIEFIRTEIIEGTAKSRELCAGWLDGRSRDSAHFQRKERISQRAIELAEALAENLGEPKVSELATSLISINGRPKSYEVVKQIRNSVLGKKVKTFFREASLQQRFDIADIAIQLFANDSEIIEIYTEDLFSTELGNVKFEHVSFSHAATAQTKLLHLMLRRLASTYDELPSTAIPDPQTEASQLATAGELMERVVDGLLAEGDQQLIWRTWQDRHHTIAGDSLAAHEIVSEFEEYFEILGRSNQDVKLKRSLHKKLGQLNSLIHNSSAYGEKKRRAVSRIEALMADLIEAPDSSDPEEGQIETEK